MYKKVQITIEETSKKNRLPRYIPDKKYDWHDYK